MFKRDIGEDHLTKTTDAVAAPAPTEARLPRDSAASLANFVLERAPFIRRAILLAMTFLVPVLFLPGVTYDPVNVPKLGILVFGTAVAAASLIAEVILGRRLDGARRLLLPAVLLTLPLFVSWLASPYRAWALFGQYERFQGLVPYVVIAVFGLLLAESFAGRTTPLLWVLAAAGGAVGGYTLIQMLGLDPFNELEVVNSSTLGHTNYVGGFLAIALPAAVYLWVTVSKWRMAAIALSVLTVVGLIAVNSQGGWVAGAAGLAVLIGALARHKWSPAWVVGAAVGALASVAVAGSVLTSMINPDLPFTGGTTATRAYLWKGALGMAAESPLVGRGPNSYTFEGSVHRPVESAVSESYLIPDDPHSVLLSYTANAGILGAVGFLAAAGWFVSRGRRSGSATAHAAFFASGVAYFVQSLVSADELSLRLGLWTALAGMVATGAVNEARRDLKAWNSGSVRPIVATGLVVAAVVGAGWWSVGWFRADHQVNQGVSLFRSEQPERAEAEFERALAFRDEIAYREAYAYGLAVTAVTREEQGGPYIDKMRTVNRYLDRLPRPSGLVTSAQLLHLWGSFDPSGDREALRLYDRALKLDPYNPLIHADRAQVLIDLGRSEEAVRALESLTPVYRSTAPEFWADLSIARLEIGDREGAEEAFTHAAGVSPEHCRVRFARELLSVTGAVDYEPAPLTGVNLNLACGSRLYFYFLDRLPAEARDLY